jgi:exonuclease VII small subunit
MRTLMNIQTQWMSARQLADVTNLSAEHIAQIGRGARTNMLDIEHRGRPIKHDRWVDEYRIPISRIPNQTGKKMARKSNAEQELADAYAEIKRQDTVIEELEHKLERFEDGGQVDANCTKALEKANGAISKLREKNDALEKKYSTQKSMTQGCLEREKDLKAEVETLQQCLTETEERIADWTRRTEDAEALNKKNDETINDLVREKTRLEGMVEDAAELLTSGEEHVKRLEVALKEAKGNPTWSDEHFTDWMGPGALAELTGMSTSTVNRRSRGVIANYQMVQRRQSAGKDYEYRALKAAVKGQKRPTKEEPKVEPPNPFKEHLLILMPEIEANRDRICGKDTRKCWALMDLQKCMQEGR